MAETVKNYTPRVEKIISFLKNNFFANRKDDSMQMFDCPNWCGDDMTEIYRDGNTVVLYCQRWTYLEVIGLTEYEYNAVFYECGC